MGMATVIVVAWLAAYLLNSHMAGLVWQGKRRVK
jgi:hypothetical protein